MKTTYGAPTASSSPAVWAEPTGRPHRLRVVLIAVAAAFVLAVPMVLLALRNQGGGPPAGSPATSGPQPTQAPDGRVPTAALRNATLNIPAWPSDGLAGRAGPVAFTDFQAAPDTAGQPYLVLVEPPSYGDVDRDGAQETLVVVRCVVTTAPERRSEQLLALDRDAAGQIVTLGTVVATTGGVRILGQRQPDGGDALPSAYDPVAIAVRADGSIDVRVGDYVAPANGDATIALWQTRTYSWNGQGFRQTGGPTSFPYNPRLTDLAVTASDLVLSSPQGRAPRGMLSVTVTLNRQVAPGRASLAVFVPPNYVIDESSSPGYQVSAPTAVGYTISTTFEPPSPGTSQTFRIALVQASPGGSGTISTRVGFDDDRLGDANPNNDEVTSLIRLPAP